MAVLNTFLVIEKENRQHEINLECLKRSNWTNELCLKFESEDNKSLKKLFNIKQAEGNGK